MTCVRLWWYSLARERIVPPENEIFPASSAAVGNSLPMKPGGAGNLTVHDVAVFAIAVPRRPGVAWALVEKSRAFESICDMIQSLVDQEVEEALRERRP